MRFATAIGGCVREAAGYLSLLCVGGGTVCVRSVLVRNQQPGPTHTHCRSDHRYKYLKKSINTRKAHTRARVCTRSCIVEASSTVFRNACRYLPTRVRDVLRTSKTTLLLGATHRTLTHTTRTRPDKGNESDSHHSRVRGAQVPVASGTRPSCLEEWWRRRDVYIYVAPLTLDSGPLDLGARSIFNFKIFGFFNSFRSSLTSHLSHN